MNTTEPKKARPKISPARRARIIATILNMDSYLYGRRASPKQARRIILDEVGIDTTGVNISHALYRLCIKPHKQRGRITRKTVYSGDEWDRINKWLERYAKGNLDMLRDTPASLARLASEFNGPKVSTAAMCEALKMRGIDLPDKPRIIGDIAFRYEGKMIERLQTS
jgi:hypothetical protein